MIAVVALFRDVYVRQVNAVGSIDIGNDQAAFREALYTLRRTVMDVVIPPGPLACHLQQIRS